MSGTALLFLIVGSLSVFMGWALFAFYRGKKADITLQEMAQELGLSYEEESQRMYGVYKGFPVQIIEPSHDSRYRNSQHDFYSVVFTIDLNHLNFPPGLTVEAKKTFPLFLKRYVPTEDSDYKSIRLNDPEFDKSFIMYTLSVSDSVELLNNPAIKLLFLTLRKSGYNMCLDEQVLTFRIAGYMSANVNKILPCFTALVQLAEALASSPVLQRSLSESTVDSEVVYGPEHPDYLEDVGVSW